MLKTAKKLKILTLGANFLNSKAISRVRAAFIDFSGKTNLVFLIKSQKFQENWPKIEKN